MEANKTNFELDLDHKRELREHNMTIGLNEIVVEELVAPTNPNKTLTVHLVPHTHDDVGWIKSVDAYFDGWTTRGSSASVRHILDGALEMLQADPRRTFTYTEMKFF